MHNTGWFTLATAAFGATVFGVISKIETNNYKDKVTAFYKHQDEQDAIAAQARKARMDELVSSQ